MTTEKIVTKSIGRTLPENYIGNPGDVWVNSSSNTIHFWNGFPGGTILGESFQVMPSESQENTKYPLFTLESGIGVDINASGNNIIVNIGQEVSPLSTPEFSSLTIQGENISPQYVGDFKFSAQLENHGKWLLCDNSALNRADYPKLFGVIGTTYGNGGKGSKKFNLPKPPADNSQGNLFIFAG